MNILVLATDFLPNPGGVAVFVHNLCVQLCKRKHHVDVLARALQARAEEDAGLPYRVYRYVSPQWLSSVIPIQRTLTLHRQHHYDVVFIGHFMTTHALGALVLPRLWGVPYVVLSHGNDLRYSISNSIDEQVLRLLLRGAGLTLANSRFTADCIRQAGYKDAIEILNPGVDLSMFHPGVSACAVRQKYLLDGRRVLLTTARLVKKKNVHSVLQALPRVIDQVADVHYLVAGDGNEREPLEALRDELGLQAYVTFLGQMEHSQLPALYCASDLFVMPSYDAGGDIETFGISFAEANACGLPVIGGRSGGTGDAVIDGETGLLVNPHSVDGITAAIIRLLSDQELARRLGKNGRWRVERELSWDKVGERLESYLKQTVDRA